MPVKQLTAKLSLACQGQARGCSVTAYVHIFTYFMLAGPLIYLLMDLFIVFPLECIKMMMMDSAGAALLIGLEGARQKIASVLKISQIRSHTFS